jgi:GntR family transcriptional regulator/MocR family aminotransferase
LFWGQSEFSKWWLAEAGNVSSHQPEAIMFSTISLNKQAPVPLYQQLYSEMRLRILRGDIRPGTRLLPTRQLAHALGVARVTVTEAYAQLEAEGFVVSRPGAGTFVADSLALTGGGTAVYQPAPSIWGERVLGVRPPAHLPVTRPDIDFGFGRSFPHIFPYDTWRRLLDRYLSTDDVMLSRYGSVAGFYPLRQALAAYLGMWRGVRCTAEQIVIVNGAQQALDILTRLYLSPGDEVLVESPGYAQAFAVFQLFGADLTPLPVDEHGFPVERIPDDCRARLVFVTPSNQFPRGGALPLPRRLALLAWARAHGAFVVEDDYDGELRYEGRPFSALQGLDDDGRVVYLGTFSKVLFPALGLSYVVLPPPMVTPFVQAKGLVDRGAPTLTQAAVADFITEGHFERHVRHLRQAYGQRRQALITALTRHWGQKAHFSHDAAGLHVMVYLPEGVAESDVVARAAEAGVGLYPGAPYHLHRPAPPSVLLGFSGLTEEEIVEGISRLADVL